MESRDAELSSVARTRILCCIAQRPLRPWAFPLYYTSLHSHLAMSCLRFPTLRSIGSLGIASRFVRNPRHWAHTMANVKHAAYCEIDAEPLQRYKPGGYHPTHLGDSLKSGRYQILHKIGWGGYATVWLAKDHRFDFVLRFDEGSLTMTQTRAAGRNKDFRLGARLKAPRGTFVSPSCQWSCEPTRA